MLSFQRTLAIVANRADCTAIFSFCCDAFLVLPTLLRAQENLTHASVTGCVLDPFHSTTPAELNDEG
jgi:hypothetical protein